MKSQLQLETQVKNGKTIIQDMYFTAPYKIMSPFYSGQEMEVMQMSATAGMLGGDEFHGEYLFGEGSCVSYTSQSYEKIFHTKGKRARRIQNIRAEKNAAVRFMPYPVIPFANSDYECETTVHLDETASFAYCDIFTCGRTGMGEYFQMKRYQSRTKVYVGNVPAFADHTLIDPERFCYNTMGMWGDYTHNGMLYLYSHRKQPDILVEQVREMGESQDFLFGVSKCCMGVVVRVLGKRGDTIFHFFQRVSQQLAHIQ